MEIIDVPNIASDPKILVQIVGARGIRRGGWFPGHGRSDCHCLIRIQGEEEYFYKTRTKQYDRIEPLWHEEIPILLEHFGENVEISVWDTFSWDEKMPAGSSSRLIGSCILTSGMYQPDGFNGELQLRGGLWGDASAAYLALKVREEGGRYPPGLDSTFHISFRRSPELPLGLDLDTQHECCVYVVDVKFGPFQFYNLNHRETERLMPGYFITEVNGRTLDSEELVEALNKETHLDLRIRRSVEMTVAVDKKDRRASLGLVFAAKGALNNLLIKEVMEGPVWDWNNSHPGLAVQAGDRVVAINSHRGKVSDLRRRMKDLERFLMTVVRPCRP